MKKFIIMLALLVIPAVVNAAPVTYKTPEMVHQDVLVQSTLVDSNRKVSFAVTRGTTMAWFSIDGADVIMTLDSNKNIDCIYIRTPVSTDPNIAGRRLGYATAMVLTAIGADYNETITIAGTDNPVIIKQTQKKVQKKATVYSGYVVIILKGVDHAKV